MKHLILILALLAPFKIMALDFADGECHRGDKKLYTCVAAPKPGDHETAKRFFTQLLFCQNPTKITYVIVTSPESEQPFTLQARKSPAGFSFSTDQNQFEITIAEPGSPTGSRMAVSYAPHSDGYKPYTSFDCSPN
jgi:hypothetical protein